MKLGVKSVLLPLLGIFLCVLGAKLFVIGHYGNPTPFWDQWDAEASSLYLPWEDGNLGLPQLVTTHNEHRILWTRLMGLLELQLNGGIWDPLFQMAANAVLHRLAIVLLLGCLRRELPKDAFAPLVLFALVLMLPFGWGNTLWGFQSQFYFLLIFGLSSIGLLTASRPLGSTWWLGCLALAASFFTVASGFLAGPAVAACYLLQMIMERKLDKRRCIGIGILLGYAFAAFLLTPVVDSNAPFKARGIHDFAVALLKALALPFDTRPTLAFFTQFPLICLFLWLVSSKRDCQTDPPPWFLIGAAIWVYLNAAAMAYGRGAGGEGPASRFMDTLYLGVVLNFAALLYLYHPFRSHWTKGALWIWMAALLTGMLATLGNYTIPVIRDMAHWHQIREAHVVQFLSDFDRERLAKLPYYDLPYPSAERLADLLENETVRRILPTPLRSSLHAGETNNWCFADGGVDPATPRRMHEKVWGSHGVFGPAGTGRITLEYAPPTKGAFLEIPVAGYPRGEGMRFHVESIAGRTLADPAPSRNPGEQWDPVYIRNPREAFRIVAEDESLQQWLAFAEPKEVGIFTLLTRATLRTWFVFLGAGIAFLILAAIGAPPRPTDPRPGESTP